MMTRTNYGIGIWKNNIKVEEKSFKSDAEAVDFLKKQGAVLRHECEYGQYWLAGTVEYVYCIMEMLM